MNDDPLDDLARGLGAARREVGQLREQVAKLTEQVENTEQMAVRIVEVERLDIGRDDVLFVHVPELADQAYVNAVAAAVHQVLGSHRVLVLAGGISVSVGDLPAEDEPTDTPTLCHTCGGDGRVVAGGQVLACATCGGGGTIGRVDG